MLEFVTRARKTGTYLDNNEISLTLRGVGTKENPYALGVILSEGALVKMGHPEYITAAISKEKDCIRVYFKITDDKEGFHITMRPNKTGTVNIPRIDKLKIQDLVGRYKLQFSKSYGYWYVEKENLNFVEKR